jgi:hypothetical protein
LVLAYEAAGHLEVSIPPLQRTRAGNAIQHDAVVLSITPSGRAALEKPSEHAGN